MSLKHLPGPKRSGQPDHRGNGCLSPVSPAMSSCSANAGASFSARLHPRHAIADLTPGQRRQLYAAILKTVRQVVEQGGRYDEYDLYGHPGGYLRVMDKNRVGQPCPECGHKIAKMQYLGGACYFCPNCQA